MSSVSPALPALRCRCCGQVLDITTDLQFQKDGRTVIIRHREYVLRWQEYRALRALAADVGRVVDRAGITARIYGGSATAHRDSMATVYIHRLRQAIAGSGLIILSDHVGGYYLEWK